MHKDIQDLLLSSKSQMGSVITAAPEANGFFKSAGISGHLPPGYLMLARRFLEDVASARRQDNVEVLEWRRGTVGEPGGWTYHAKGKLLRI